MQSIEPIKQNLQYILKVLHDGTYEAQKPIIQVMMNETVEAVQKTTFKYDAPYNNENYLHHHHTFVCLSRKAKCSLMADIQQLQSTLARKNFNVKTCEAIINKLLQSNLYQCEVQGVINNWVNLSPAKHPTKHKKISVY
jgi:hypothetical protein